MFPSYFSDITFANLNTSIKVWSYNDFGLYGRESDFDETWTRLDLGRYRIFHNEQTVTNPHFSSPNPTLIQNNFRSVSSERVISDDLKSKIQEWNRADSALFDAVNAEFWKKVKDYGFDKMQIEIKELHARIDELMEFCVAGKTSFVPKWSEAAIELGCQNQNQTNASHNCFLKFWHPSFRAMFWQKKVKNPKNAISWPWMNQLSAVFSGKIKLNGFKIFMQCRKVNYKTSLYSAKYPFIPIF